MRVKQIVSLALFVGLALALVIRAHRSTKAPRMPSPATTLPK